MTKDAHQVSALRQIRELIHLTTALHVGHLKRSNKLLKLLSLVKQGLVVLHVG